MSDELKMCPCNVCKKIPIPERSIIDIAGDGSQYGEYWEISCHHTNDDEYGSTIYVTYPTKEATIKEWNKINESDELPEWMKEKIKARLSLRQEEVGDPLTFNLIRELNWVLSLRRGDE